jgi:hypothetical protein
MKQFTVKTLFAALCLIAVIGCEDDPVTPIEPPAPAPATNLVATPVDQTTIRLN